MQVVKDPLKTKGARLSMQLSIAGRYLVYVPDGEGVGVSRRLRTRSATGCASRPRAWTWARAARSSAPPRRERRARTSSARCTTCTSSTRSLQKRAKESPAPAMVFQEADLPVRVIRDIFSEQFERGIVDDEKAHHRLVSFFTRTSPELLDRLELYTGKKPLFESTAIEDAIKSTLSRRVDLPVGRLPDDRLRRGDDGHRHQLGLVHRARQGRAARGHDHEDEPRGGRGDRAPAQAARHRRNHRHRLHRHVPRAQPRRGAEGAAQGARRGPHEDLRHGDLAARAGRDDAPERDRRRARDPHEDVPDLRGRGRGAVRGDGRARDRAPPARPRGGEPGARGLPRTGAPARVVTAPRSGGGPAAARARAARSASTSTSRAAKGCRSTGSSWSTPARATRSSSKRCRSARARSSWSRSRSRTCTTRTPPSARSTRT